MNYRSKPDMPDNSITESIIDKELSDQFSITETETSRINDVDLDNPGFGRQFTDHMFSIEYRDGKWQQPEIVPFQKIEFLPSLAALHYGQAIFEGMKAFRNKNGNINVFRPDKHHARLNKSCRRMCIPETDKDTFINALDLLINMDHDWVPTKKGNALYIRPFIFATDEHLAVKASQTYRFFIINSPVGAYYKEGINPVSLLTSGKYVRSVQGGAGFIKTAGNYAPTILPAQEAHKKGFTQVLWLDAIEHKYIEEVGTMNIFFKIGDRLITPPLEGSILGGVTRDSVIQISKEWGIPVEERRISIDEVFEAYEKGTLQEAFGTGTAAVISPVGRIEHEGKVITLDEDKIGPYAQRLYNEVTAIQYGEKEDTHDWIHTIFVS
ncbi:MAG TPA: branched-chain amino acid aminotransferase [Balneolales bacterium]|nr:branched-chain amino acid aminotransferase [Balneolales bacterium]